MVMCATNGNVCNQWQCVQPMVETKGSDHGEEEEAIPAELECNICMKLLYCPVSTPCGHNFCRDCLQRSLSYRLACPVCRRALLQAGEPNRLLGDILRRLCPRHTADRRREELAAAREADEEDVLFLRNVRSSEGPLPLFPLPGLTVPLFPSAVLRLNIYESRYISMVQHVTQGSNMFLLMTEVPSPLSTDTAAGRTDKPATGEAVQRTGRSTEATPTADLTASTEWHGTIVKINNLNSLSLSFTLIYIYSIEMQPPPSSSFSALSSTHICIHMKPNVVPSYNIMSPSYIYIYNVVIYIHTHKRIKCVITYLLENVRK
eukprot:GHVS01100356.1.p1 GENE.GHVS01100356.1~~GHVS01100356.1.p1  ORF type:complete len:318 (-),score=34.18 GHVS01100356.1:31-984(-)